MLYLNPPDNGRVISVDGKPSIRGAGLRLCPNRVLGVIMSDFADKIKGIRIHPALLVEQVTKALTEAILQGVFKGGDQLIESELQKTVRYQPLPYKGDLSGPRKARVSRGSSQKGDLCKESHPEGCRRAFSHSRLS